MFNGFRSGECRIPGTGNQSAQKRGLRYKRTSQRLSFVCNNQGRIFYTVNPKNEEEKMIVKLWFYPKKCVKSPKASAGSITGWSVTGILICAVMPHRHFTNKL